MMEEHELGGKLLSSVSRSFYLTLKALPAGLREPLSLAYLLARAADTLADTVHIPEEVRVGSLDEFSRLVQAAQPDPEAEARYCASLRDAFVPRQSDADEAMLLERLPEALQAFWRSTPTQRHSIQGVLQPIVTGQRLDIQRFPVDGQLRALRTTEELEEYTYLVAGCVGEFWTKLSASEAADAFTAEVSDAQMIEWGIRYGRGLQLVNILRDIGKDMALGRCYFPENELAAHGWSLEDVRQEPSRLLPVIRPWIQRCRGHLQAGIQYIDHVQNKRIRYASALPLLIGIRTLALIEQADWPTLQQGIKISRGDVSKTLLEAGIASLRSHGLKKMAEKMMPQ